MFSRTALRAVAPLRQTAPQTQPLLYRRTYVSAPPGHMGTNTGMVMYMLGGGALAGVGYWYYASGGKPFIPVGNASKKRAEAQAQAQSQGTAPHTSFSDKGQKASGEKTFKGGDQGFIDLKLEAVENVNHNTKRLRFALPEGEVSGLEVASAILTSYKGPEASKPTMRPYTPISDEDSVGYLDLLVKKYPEGPMSTHLHDMEPGQRLNFKGPLPKYPLKENAHKHIALIAGGTGITPMYQLCRAVFNNPNDTTQVTLVFGNVSEEDILLKREFEELENKYPRRFRAFYVLNNPPEGYQGGKGMIDKTLLKTVLPEPKEGNIKVFVCGPPGLYKAISGTKKSVKDQGEVEGILKELGYSKEQVYKF